MTLKTRIGASIATVTLLSSLFVQAAFADELTISDNGKNSYNKIKVTDNCTQTVVQGNSTYITNDVTSQANTGGNIVSDNGGDLTLTTGEANSIVTIVNNGSSNEATLSPCCCGEQTDGLSAVISGNLEGSTNKIKKYSNKTSSGVQGNETMLVNLVWSKAKTGKNQVKDNLGSVNVTTKNAKSQVGITNDSPTNTLNP